MVFLIAAAVFGALAVLIRPGLYHDPDVYWHLAAGDWMVRHLEVLRRDEFSYTIAGQPWIAQEWLSEVVMSLAYRAGGWAGLTSLFCVVGGLTAWLMARQLSRSLSGISAVFTLIMGLVSMSSALLARPHILVVPILVLWTTELLNARAAGRAPRWWMAGLMVLWANMHGSFVFGFVLLAAFALEALLETWRTPSRVIFSWGAFGFLSLAAAFATPLGLDGLLHPLHTMSLGGIRAIDEWRSPDFSKVPAFELALLTAIVVCLHRGVAVPAVRVALLALLLHMALQHQRHILILAAVAPLILAGPLARALGQSTPPALRNGWKAAAGAAVLVGLLVAGRLAIPLERPLDEYTPKAAVDHVPRALAARPVFNHYNFGGYLIFRGIRTYIDGRADLYGSKYFENYLKAWTGDPATIDSILTRNQVDWTITPRDDLMVPQMDRRPGWKRIYADKQAVVHARIGAPGVP